MTNANDFQVEGSNPLALFTLKLHRGDGMLLLGMNWKNGQPPDDFVGFAIEYREPGGIRFFPLKNRIAFPGADGTINPNRMSTMLSPIQKFRWVHFPRNAELPGLFSYKVTPVFMNTKDELSYGEAQTADIQLARETYPGRLNVAFTRGYVSSQSFTDRYITDKNSIRTLLPAKSADGVKFKATHPKAQEALAWMGFEGRSCLLELLDKALADRTANVDVVAYDLSEGLMISKLKALGKRLRIIIDDAGEHGKPESGENQAERILVKSAGRASVKRQHMGSLQHNKMIIVDGSKIKAAVGGSTNFSWRGFYVQSNNALVVFGKEAIAPFQKAFNNYFENENQVGVFAATSSAKFVTLPLKDIKAKVTFSPHSKDNAILDGIASDVKKAKSSVFFSLAFLYQTPGAMKKTFLEIARKKDIFLFGISDKPVKSEVSNRKDKIDFLTPDGRRTVVNPAALSKTTLPEPFKSEATGGNGVRLHHKFVVVDFDKPTARVYLGSYNFSIAADRKNGENLFLIRDRRIAVSYMIEALRIFDQYQFRLAQQDAKTARKKLFLIKPPRKRGEKAWWKEDYVNPRKIKDREVFA